MIYDVGKQISSQLLINIYTNILKKTEIELDELKEMLEKDDEVLLSVRLTETWERATDDEKELIKNEVIDVYSNFRQTQ